MLEEVAPSADSVFYKENFLIEVLDWLTQSKVKVSELIAEALENLGIKHVFGIIGAGNVHLFEAITKRGYSEIVCVHHEQAACMAVQTYYRTNGRLAAALLTTGAGATNGVTGVVSAWADSIPCVVIAGNENSKFTYPENPLRMWGVQGYDSCQMVSRVSKYVQRVTEPEQAVYELEKAVHIAFDGRPGPTWIEIPMDQKYSFRCNGGHCGSELARDSGRSVNICVECEAAIASKLAPTGSLFQVLLELFGRLQHRRTHRWHLAHHVEQTVIVDQAVVAHRRDRHPSLVEFAGVGFALVAQHVGAGGLHQGRWQALELRGGRPQRRGVDLVTLFGVGGVVVPEPLHHVFGEEVPLGKLVVGRRLEAGVSHRPQQQPGT